MRMLAPSPSSPFLQIGSAMLPDGTVLTVAPDGTVDAAASQIQWLAQEGFVTDFVSIQMQRGGVLRFDRIVNAAMSKFLLG